MKILPTLKTVGVAVLSLGIAVGCASQQQQPEQPAKQEAMPSKAQMAADAIAAAKAAAAKANALGYEWRDTGKMIKEAEKLAAAGKYDEAIALANKAREQGELAVKQHNMEQGMDRSVPAVKGMSSYTVMKGDSLWRIAGKQEVYGNPYEWPLIYKANSSKIKDADLIYPGQDFDINTAPSDAEVSAAVRHAKTRGAWSLGKVEASDKAYLGM
jgi:nucleoid-associated protein YgaU